MALGFDAPVKRKTAGAVTATETPCGMIGVRHIIPGVSIPGILSGDGITEAMAEMDPSIAKSDPGQGRGQEHLRLRLAIFGILDGTWQILHGLRKA